jgi:maltooligosyltrehalose trehalohydrolase
VKFLSQFPSIAAPEVIARLPEPSDAATFRRCKLDFAERRAHAEAYALHRDLLRLRRQDAVFGAPRRGGVDGAVLGTEAFVLRFFGSRGDDRLLLVNFGADLQLSPVPEPLLAPPAGQTWKMLWSSEDPRYGGGGTPPLQLNENWRLPGGAVAVLAPSSADETNEQTK